MQDKENKIKILIRRAIIFKNFLLTGIRIEFAEPYWHHKATIQTLIVSGIINLITWLFLFAKRIDGNFPIILHYNLFFGVDSVGDYRKIFLLPTVGLVVFVLNAILGKSFFKIERLASYLIILNILIVEVFILLSSYLIIKANS